MLTYARMIAQNLASIRTRVAGACNRSARKPEDITLVAVSKGVSAELIGQALDAGITDIGENRLQEALSKHQKIKPVKWHMVGHLQTNKAKDAVKIFDLIHSVDSTKLAQVINKAAFDTNKIQDVLIEVNTSGETAKFGLKPSEVIEVTEETSKLKNIRIKGLMTIAPAVDTPEISRPYFVMLRELMDKLNQLTSLRLTVLSMGMSGDFEIAIEEGANMIRLGRAIFQDADNHG